jgi:hypothetical protein
MISKIVNPKSMIILSLYPSIVSPFLSIIKLFEVQLSPSAILTIDPVVGEEGNVSVNVPPDVSAII